MKIIANKFFITTLFLLGRFVLFAGPSGPPPPAFKKPPPPPGLPIDDSVFLVLIFAVVFGIYSIYNHNIKTKTPN